MITLHNKNHHENTQFNHSCYVTLYSLTIEIMPSSGPQSARLFTVDVFSRVLLEFRPCRHLKTDRHYSTSLAVPVFGEAECRVRIGRAMVPLSIM